MCLTAKRTRRLSGRLGLGQRSGRDVALYVDDAIWRWQGLQWAHLLADDIDELHRFASALGINPQSYQGPPRTSVPHYDLTAYERRSAIARGAIACSRDEIVAVLRRARSAHDPSTCRLVAAIGRV